MSIIPYGFKNHEVVLRHDNSVVVYNPESQRLEFNRGSRGPLELTKCPTCQRPYRDQSRVGSQERGHGPARHPGYVHPEYFRILHENLYGTLGSSSPPSPRRRLVQPVGSPGQPTVDSNEAILRSSPSASPPSPTGISATAFSPGYFERCYVVEKELGRGGKGVVLLVTHMLDDNVMGQFACKRVPVGDDREWLRAVLKEVHLLYHLEHKHLVRYHHVWLEDVKISNFGPSVPCAFILQQYCNSGDLQNYVLHHDGSSDTSPNRLKERIRRRSKGQPELPQELHNRRLSFDEIKSFFNDVASGLNHLHVNGYIHRDLKPSNCLLHDDGHGDRPRVLVSDFGEVQVIDMVRKSTGATGTISYCAPEVLRRQSSGEYGNFTTKSDIFSLGMILYFLCFAQLPYTSADVLNEDNEDLDELREEITTWSGLREERKLRPDLPEQLYTFLRRLLSLDPDERPSAEAILLGIKTGAGLDRISDTRPRSSGHMFEDLRGDSRISPVDSPRPSTPVRKTSTSILPRLGGPAKLRLFQKERSRSPTPGTETLDEKVERSSSEEPLSPGGSLIVRDRFPSPAKIPEVTPMLTAPPILPAVSNPQPWSLQRKSTQRGLKMGLLLLKLISVNWLCTPMAANQVIAYPLFALAALDILIRDSQPLLSAALVAVHISVLLLAKRRDVLCMPGMVYRRDI
ncbi:putative serine/threonine-protein kinase iks1 [Lecanora helva]